MATENERTDRKGRAGGRLRPLVGSSLVLAALCACGAGPAAAQSFTTSDLGTLTDGTKSWANGIGPAGASAGGTVVGSGLDADGKERAIVRKHGGSVVALPMTDWDDTSVALAINASGVVVGSAKVSADVTHAVVWKDGNTNGAYEDAEDSKVDLGTLKAENAGSSAAWAINASGLIVGCADALDEADTPADAIHGVVWKLVDGTYTKIDLGTLLDDEAGVSHATAVSDSGIIAGWSAVAGDKRHAVLWQDLNSDGDYKDSGEEVDLGTLGGDNSEAKGVNKAGQVVGWAEVSTGKKHAFLYVDEAMIDLGTLGGDESAAYAINTTGQIVGTAQSMPSDTNVDNAFLYSDGVMYDLNDLSSTLPMSRTLKVARSINDALQITGDSKDDTNEHAFHVTPDSPVKGVTLKAATVKGAKAVGGTVELDAAAPAGGALVTLKSSAAAAVVPASVIVAEGKTTATFSITTTAVATDTDAVITASRGVAKPSSNLKVQAPVATKVALKPASIAAGSPVTGTVTLDGVAPDGGLDVSLASENEEVAQVPESGEVNVPAGKNSATFTVTTDVDAEAGSVKIFAAVGEVTETSASASLGITSTLVSAVTIAPATLAGGKSAVGTVTLTGKAPAAGRTVTLASDKADAVVPATVKVPSGKTSVTFPITTKAVAADVAAVVTGSTSDTNKKTAKLKITAPLLTSLSISKSSVTGGATLKGIVTLSGRAAANTEVTLSDGESAAVTGMGTSFKVTIKAGATSASFSITTSDEITADAKATLKATIGKVSKSVSLTVKKPAASS